MKKRPYDLGKGTVFTVEAEPDLAKLPRRLRSLISPRLQAAWEAQAATFEGLAKRAKSPAFAHWLHLAAGARAALDVYDPAEHFEPRAFLELDFGPATSRQGASWKLLVDFRDARLPRACPPALANVYASIGELMGQYGASGRLVFPAPMEKWARAALDPERQIDWKPWRVFWEADGDFLLYRADGAARWVGDEWGGHSEGEGLRADDAVDDVFRHLIRREDFHAH